MEPDGATGRLSATPWEGAITGRSSGVNTTRKPLRNSKSLARMIADVPLVVIGVVSFARDVTVGEGSPLFSLEIVTAEPPEPAVTVAGKRISRIGLASHADRVRWPPSMRWILKAMPDVAVRLSRSWVAETAT